MLNPFKTCLSSLQKRAKVFLHHHILKKTPEKIPSISLSDISTPSFAAIEITTQFEQIFNQIDTNRDGKVSSFELSQLLLCLGYEDSEARKEAEILVRVMDSNGDGFVEVDEFIDSLKCCNRDEYLKGVFEVFDVDKNGLISYEDLHKVLRRVGWDKCSIEECRGMIEIVDKDRDGFVDFQEFREMMTSSLG